VILFSLPRLLVLLDATNPHTRVAVREKQGRNSRVAQATRVVRSYAFRRPVPPTLLSTDTAQLRRHRARRRPDQTRFHAHSPADPAAVGVRRTEVEMKPKSLPFIAFEHKRCVPYSSRCSRLLSLQRGGVLPLVDSFRPVFGLLTLCC
jgi:hypothetical protein